MPRAALRYSLLHGLVEQAHASIPIRRGAYEVAPEVYYSFPTFDGDSIFNVFSSQPYLDLRATVSRAPRGARLATYLRGWARRFAIEDPEQAAPAPTRATWAWTCS